ncbi:DNA glycosylase AlkZ-like family protein [Actinomycetospora lemnae]|uniref:Crosslink repair DNA glycosylase YcaQ family protein n=1 Tax=Actinomycetospora lemnae TaxID=3019891 RepID=A0ABT5SZ20_9PSEU|nr:crosslink repair DNA glycosylase YcaQ family protein [Actinomycetospora sp. DW7H6]MDD7967381.1 crosslink repair DNA glycosylase YcaQ family protein [Actinomycetospora sp. DW7H6]
MVETLTREQVMAHRIAAQGLHRDRPAAIAALASLGLQDAGPTARLALAARSDGDPDPVARGLVDGWTHRGAPHHHPPDERNAIAAAARPFDDADAAARLNWSGPEQRRVGIPAREAIDRAADALAEVVTEPLTKGAASGAVTKLLPDALLRDCRGCATVHVNEQLFRLSAFPVGVGLDPTGRTLLLIPPPAGWERPVEGDPGRAARLVLDYLRVLGPAGPREVADFVGTSAAAFAPAWEAALPGLVEVEVEAGDGAQRSSTRDVHPAWLPADELDAALGAPDPDVVRFLPPLDPMLQARDRPLLVPDEALRKDLYKIIGNPGALLADGEVVGTWRPRASGKKLTLEVAPVVPLAPDVRARLDDEAERVAAARGLRLAGITGV